jgi:Fe-S oxidoreductase
VDVAKLKYEFLAQYYARHGTPLRARLFGNVDALNRLGCAFAPLSSWIAGSLPSRWIMDRLFGIHRNRTLPPFARETFPAWFARRSGARPAATHGQVVLFDDTYMRYNYPEIGRAAVAVLEAAGFEVLLAERKCCGRPLISKGLIDQARENAAYNIEKLSPYIQAGIPIVGVEPSCVLTFRDEYPSLVDEPRAERLARHVLMIEEFLVRLHETGRLALPLRSAATSVLLHGHCHQKALVGSSPSLEVLRMIPGAAVSEIDSGCCGMAGSFGYEKEHYDLSLAIGERRLFPAVRQAGEGCAVVAAGVSCRQQIAHGTGRRAKHLVEVLAEALGAGR